MHANDMQKGTHVSVHIYRLTLSSQMLSTSHQSYTRATNSRPPWYSVFAHLRPHHRPLSPSIHLHPHPFLLPASPPPPPRPLTPKGHRACKEGNSQGIAPTRAKQWARERYGRGVMPPIFLASEGNYRGGAWSSAKQGERERGNWPYLGRVDG